MREKFTLITASDKNITRKETTDQYHLRIYKKLNKTITNQIQQMYKRLHHDQGIFLEIQSWLNIHKLTSIIHHINRAADKVT